MHSESTGGCASSTIAAAGWDWQWTQVLVLGGDVDLHGRGVEVVENDAVEVSALLLELLEALLSAHVQVALT